MSELAERSHKDTHKKLQVPDTALEELVVKSDAGDLLNVGFSASQASGSPNAMPPSKILHLQRLVGNQAVQHMLNTPAATQTVQRQQESPALEDQQVGLDGMIAPPLQLQETGERKSLQRWDWGNAGIGAAAGAIGGAAIGSFLGPIGAGVGALVGGLAGGLIGGLISSTPDSPEVAKKKAAGELVINGGTGTDADREVVIAEMIKMPIEALAALKKGGIKVVVCRNSVTEVREDLKGVQPRGWPDGMTWDTVPGLFDTANKRVIIATRGGVVPPTGDGHGASNLVLHEVGHAVGHAATTGGEDDPRFIEAREKDKAQLDSYEGQAGHPGIEETYAESFARFYGGVADDARIYPNLHAYWASNPLVAD